MAIRAPRGRFCASALGVLLLCMHAVLAAAGTGAQAGAVVTRSEQASAFSLASDEVTDMVVGAGGTSEVALRNEPIQLVRPLAQGDGLEVTPEGAAFLRSLPSHLPLHVVGVVGPFHGGKSFLLNQIMGRQGFRTGVNVNPTTKGLWTWATPATVEGAEFGVLFLDTEGFAASDVTADYDAKVFAVASLISSSLLYNSVRNIDQASIDYLELLARRTQLFQLKTAVSGAGARAHLNATSMFPMPPLTWVVEDFFTATADGETPSEWLERLLVKPHKDSGGGRSALPDIFPSIDCHTLFLPSTSRTLLQDLSAAKAGDLTPEFKEGVAELTKHIVERLLANPPLRSGPQLASLLEVLVEASNTGSFSNIPSMWNLYIETQLREASEASTQCFTLGMNNLMVTNPPIPAPAFETASRDVVAKCSALFRSLLVGVDVAVAQSASMNHEASTSATTDEMTARHNKAIVAFCDKAAQDIKDTVRATIQEFGLPMNSKTLVSRIDTTIEEQLTPHTTLTSSYGDVCTDSHRALEADLSSIKAHHVNANSEKHRAVMQGAVKEGHADYVEAVEEKFRSMTPEEAMTDDDLHAFDEVAIGKAVRAFEAFAKVSKDEPEYIVFLDHMKSNRPIEDVRSRNSQRIADNANKVADNASARVSASCASVRVPIELSMLDSRVDKFRDDALAQFDSSMQRWAKQPVVAKIRKELQEDIANLRAGLKDRNDREWMRIFKRPLQAAKRELRAEAKSAWSSFLLRRAARRIAEENILMAKDSSDIDPAMRARVVEAWVHDESIAEIISAADVWQNVAIGLSVTIIVLLAVCFKKGKR